MLGSDGRRAVVSDIPTSRAAVGRLHLEERPRVDRAIQKVLSGHAKEYSGQYRLRKVPVTQQLIAEGAILPQKPVSRLDLLRKIAEMLHGSSPADGSYRA